MRRASDFEPRDIYFKSYSDAAIVLDTLTDLADQYNNVTVGDFCDVAAIPCPSQLRNDVWAKDLFADVKVLHNGVGQYYIDLPRPLSVVKPYDPNETKRIPYNRKCIEKEKEPMASIGQTWCECELVPIDEGSIAYQKQVQEIKETAEKKIQKIRDEAAKKLDALKKERYWAMKKKVEEEHALYWKTKYDALVSAGFTDTQAWQMCMKSFETD